MKKTIFTIFLILSNYSYANVTDINGISIDLERKEVLNKLSDFVKKEDMMINPYSKTVIKDRFIRNNGEIYEIYDVYYNPKNEKVAGVFKYLIY